MIRKLTTLASFLQIGIGILLLVRTIQLTTTTRRSVREESQQISANLTAAADALVATRETYAHTATNLFSLTSPMGDVGEKVKDIAGKFASTGEKFAKQGNSCEEFSHKLDWTIPLSKIPVLKLDDLEIQMGDPFRSLAEWCKNSGEQFTDIGTDIASVAMALKKQGNSIGDYRDNGHDKTLKMLEETIESLRHAEKLLDGGRSAVSWCNFVCVLGLCVSLLFLTNGALLLLFARQLASTPRPTPPAA